MAQKKQQDTLIETIQNNYVSALIGLIIVILGIGYIYNSIKARNAVTDTKENQEQMQEDNQDNSISGRTYKVQKGDTLWSIAERKYESGYNYTDIVVANKLKNENDIEIGQSLMLPDVKAKTKTTGNVTPTQVVTKPTATVTPQPTKVQPTQQPKVTMKVEVKKAPITINGTSYTVVKGDSLWNIAVRAYGDGYKWTQIWNANKKMISNPDLIYSGSKLTLPR